MSQRKKPRKQQKPRRRVARSTRMETLEVRQVMSADPLGIPALGHHAIVEDEVPTLTQHALPPLSHHALLEPEPGSSELTHHAGLVAGGGSLNTGFFEPEPGYDPNADFWLDTTEIVADDLGEQINQLLNEAHQVTGQDEVVSKYGFDGAGQTVVVIDSGIAWDHYALGGGYGEDYRVVGGWDFTENDADPYDDGPAGSHGTHVAGIVGASNGGNDDGVATGVDLVGLRVFDDAGNGYFSWVESALSWVHANKDSFNNPITAVNLSLGTEWNSDSVPAWAMLEEEFAALEADGIFVSVSAGNSFQNFNTPGVSYPAASDHVIPVMSLDSNGQLSYFSQRAEYAIAAPGRWITSTVPDYAAGDADTITDDWASMSGTSMAAPYIAGASVLVREAMEFVGMADIDQWDIFNHMMATGDRFFDSATSAWYTELNLEAAIDALMPTDDYGSTAGTAHDLGTIDPPSANPLAQSQTSGVISTLDDTDHFTFTAGATGTATFTVADATHNLAVNWEGGGWTSIGAGVYTIEVSAGQSYSFAIGTTGGLGYYDFTYELESSFSAIEWGAVGAQQTREGVAVSGEAWFNVTAGAGGYLTADVVATSGAVTLAWYDAQQNLLAGEDGAGRVDTITAQGEQLLLRVTGETTDLDLRLTNAVSVDGSTVSVLGTAGDDALTFTAGTTEHAVSLNGVEYSFDAGSYEAFGLDGGGGYDSVTMNGTSAAETATLRVGTSSLAGTAYSATASNIERVDAYGNGGGDGAYLYDSQGADRLTATPHGSRMEAVDGSYENNAVGFAKTYSFASGGYDTAELFDGASDDFFRGTTEFAVLRGDGYEFFNYAQGFDRVYAYSTGGFDEAHLEDSEADDFFRGTTEFAVLRGDGYEFFNYAQGFDRVYAYSTGGFDEAHLEDSEADDFFRGTTEFAVLRGDGYEFFNYAQGFDRVYAYSTGGFDEAHLEDSEADDFFRGTTEFAVLRGDGYEFFNYAQGFDRVYAYSTGGFDEAHLEDSEADDFFRGTAEFAVLRGDGYEFFNYAQGFDRVYAYSTGGFDEAHLEDSEADDFFRGTTEFAVLRGDNYEFFNYVQGFDRNYAYSSGGYDEAVLEGGVTSDFFRGTDSFSVMRGQSYDYFNYADGFDRITSLAGTGGNDVAYLYDTTGDDELTVDGGEFSLDADGFYASARGFDAGYAYSLLGGVDTISETQAADFAFSEIGDWV